MIGLNVNVKRTGRFATNPRAVEHDIRGANERGIFKGWLLVRRSLREKMSQKGGHDAFWGRTTTTEGLLVRTGLTRSRLSPAYRPVRLPDRVVAAVGSPDQHVADLEQGGRKSAGAGWFRIPLAAAQTAAGVDRFAGRSIRGAPGFFLWRSRINNRLLASRRQPGQMGGVPWYLFVKTMFLRGRHMFARTVAETTSGVVAAVGREVALVVAKANT